MTNLEQLLKDKYPDSEISDIQRRAFIEGYNAAKEEYAKPVANQNVNMEVLLGNCAAMIKAGHKSDAIMTYKRATGASISETANILGITTKY